VCYTKYTARQRAHGKVLGAQETDHHSTIATCYDHIMRCEHSGSTEDAGALLLGILGVAGAATPLVGAGKFHHG
jgi:hypothetical protein